MLIRCNGSPYPDQAVVLLGAWAVVLTLLLGSLLAPEEALDKPLKFPSWFLKITCDCCGKDRMLCKAHVSQRCRK
jgi:hypothetical protein